MPTNSSIAIFARELGLDADVRALIVGAIRQNSLIRTWAMTRREHVHLHSAQVLPLAGNDTPNRPRNRAGFVRLRQAQPSSQIRTPHLDVMLLVPYVPPFSEDAVANFRHAVSKELAVPDDRDLASASFTKRLLAVLENEERRLKLKSCYSILSSDNNKPSLSLFSGPYPGTSAKWRSYRRMSGGGGGMTEGLLDSA